MPSRRQIREAVVQYLYSTDLEAKPSNISDENHRNAFWAILSETERKRLALATMRLLEHLTAGRSSRLLELTERSQTTLAHLASEKTESLKKNLLHILHLESSWSAHFDELLKIPLKDVENENTVYQIELALKKILTLDAELLTSRQTFFTQQDDFPLLKPHLEAINATLRRCQRIAERSTMLANPSLHPEQNELKMLREQQADIQTFYQDSNALAELVIKHLPQTDLQISAVLENFKLERVSPIDRAILRLATTELLNRTHITNSVIINEAIDLAKKFGTEDSGRFVHGILDGIAKLR